MDSLISSQIDQLIVLKPEVEKNAFLDSATERKLLQLDSLGWEKELKIFREANIDKPAYYGSYNMLIQEHDTFSNLLYDEYKATDSEKLTVKSLRVYYLESKSSLKKVEILMKDKNELFESQRELLMIFDERNGLPLLSSYEVMGSQKLKLNKSVNYEMIGNLTY